MKMKSVYGQLATAKRHKEVLLRACLDIVHALWYDHSEKALAEAQQECIKAVALVNEEEHDEVRELYRASAMMPLVPFKRFEASLARESKGRG